MDTSAHTRSKLAATAVVVALAASACTLTTTPPERVDPTDKLPEAQSVTLVQATSCEDLVNWVTRQEGNWGDYGYREDVAVSAPSSAVDGGEESSGDRDDLGGVTESGTNVQVAGVDELDSVKLSDGVLTMSTPDGVDIHLTSDLAAGIEDPVATIAVSNRYWVQPQQLRDSQTLFLVYQTYEGNKDRVVKGDREEGITFDEDLAQRTSGEPEVHVDVYDLADPTSPVLIASTGISGYLSTARLVDGKPVVVTSPAGHWDIDELTNNNVVKLLSPTVTRVSDDSETKHVAAGCEDIWYPTVMSPYGVTAVTMLNADGSFSDAATVMTSSGITYMDQDSVYMATQLWEPTSQDVTISQSAVHAFTLGDSVSYHGSTVVDGTLLSQWAMDVHDGHLRIASTVDPSFGWWPQRSPLDDFTDDVVPESLPDASGTSPVEADTDTNEPASGGDQSNIVEPTPLPREGTEVVPEPVLPPQPYALVTVINTSTLNHVGVSEKFGETERVQGVRFMGDMGFVVTFLRTDPLYTFDLSDPTAPTIVGELKMPGFSAYLHPYGDGNLFGVGSDADAETGRTTGAMTATFNVSDLSNPTLVDRVTYRDTQMMASWDHHAFTWHQPSRSAVLAATSWDDNVGSTAAFLIVSIDKDGTQTVSQVARQGWFPTRAVAEGDNVFLIFDRGILVTQP